MEVISKNRRDTVTDETIVGPVHAHNRYGLTWCGRKLKGFRVLTRPGSPEDVTCRPCRVAHATGRPRSWRKRR